jgi:hypothetical protein
MIRAFGEFIIRMKDSIMLLTAQMNDSVIGSEAVRVDYAFEADLASNDLHRCRSANIRHDLGLEFAVSFVDAEDDGFARSAATAPAFK